VLGPGGVTTYSAYNASLGYGQSGFAVFAETAGTDVYNCGLATCHGHATSKGLAVFSDTDGNETIPLDGKDEVWETEGTSVWRHGNLALGVNS